ncbi:MAG: Rhs family protein [Gammaproteobacteria bacterium]|nr:MAG: Rhs family protein [Gammaproteobacteria bacterium]
MQFSYDAEHQMKTAIITKNGVTQHYHYAYDPFGRRISKADAFNTTHFTWDGNRLLSESRGSRTKTYVYEQEGFVPVAHIVEHLASPTETPPTVDKPHHNAELLYYHTDHLGTPRELTDRDGHIVWAARYKAWGNTLTVDYPELQAKAEPLAYPMSPEDIDRLDLKAIRQRRADKANRLIEQWQEDYTQNLRFQGQYFDEETGPHYNRFRYYDPDVGRFVTQDPIGLLGGGNLYFYAPNPIRWADPYGLTGSIATATHITYLGSKGGKPYVGYASMQGCKDPLEVLRYRYGNNFAKEGLDGMPEIIYSGYGQDGKDVARGMEQKTFEDLEGGKNTSKNTLRPKNTANEKNPVGAGNKRRKEYMHKAGKERKKCPCDIDKGKPDC